MNSVDIYQNLCEIFETKEINYELFNRLDRINISEFKTTLKSYLLQFLIDKEDKSAVIKSYNDLWFSKANVSNKDVIIQYINLIRDMLKVDSYDKLNIYKDIEVLMVSDIEEKICLIISILNNLYLPDQIILLFIGFILGEKILFIKKNYVINLKELLKMVKINISSIDLKMKIVSFDKNILETFNLYIFFLSCKKLDKKSIKNL